MAQPEESSETTRPHPAKIALGIGCAILGALIGLAYTPAVPAKGLIIGAMVGVGVASAIWSAIADG